MSGCFLRILIILFCFISFSSFAETVRVISWNVREGFSNEEVEQRAAEFKKAGDELKPDVLMLQEVCSIDVVNAIRDAMGLEGYYTACSDFSQDDDGKFASLECGLISRYPINQVIEYDPTPDNNYTDNDPAEMPVFHQAKFGIAPTSTYRGFLWAKIDSLKMIVYNCHLKSARGQVGIDDATNAQQREYVAATMAVGVLQDLNIYDGYSVVVAGDFNVGHSDTKKNGTDLFEDCYINCEDRDGYDDTHAIFHSGMIGGLKMKNLTLSVTDPTYPDYPGTPIDNIYAVGSGLENYSDSVLGTSTFGSDHLPVISEYTINSITRVETLAEYPMKNHLSPFEKGYAEVMDIYKKQAKQINYQEAKDHVGEIVWTTGRIVRADNIGNITFLNFQKEKGGLTGVIFSDNYNKFDPPAENQFNQKMVRIMGQMTEYRGTPQIVIRDPEQIQMIGGVRPVKAVVAQPKGNAIPWQEAKNYKNQKVTIEGKVVRANDIGTITFINFSRKRGDFTVVIGKDDYSSFPNTPVKLYDGKNIQITGTVTEYKGAPQIKVSSPDQIQIVGANSVQQNKAPGNSETTGDVVHWKQAAKHVGKSVVVEGKISATNNIGSMTFLNFSRTRGDLTLVVYKNSYGKFSTPAEKLYKGKMIRVKGTVTEYQGKPQIVIDSPDQIEIKN